MKIRYLYTFSFSEKVLFNSFSDAQLKVLEDKLKCNYAIVTKKTEEIVEFKINPFKTPNWTTMGGANRGEFYLTTNGRQNKLVYKIEFKFVFNVVIILSAAVHDSLAPSTNISKPSEFQFKSCTPFCIDLSIASTYSFNSGTSTGNMVLIMLLYVLTTPVIKIEKN